MKKQTAIRFLSLIIACALLGSLSGCGDPSDPPSSSSQTTASTTAQASAAPTTVLSTTAEPTPTTTLPTARPVDPADMGKVVPNDFIINIEGVEVHLLDDPAALLEALGEPESENERKASGIWAYRSGSYSYPAVGITTGRYEDGTEQIKSIVLRGPATIITNKGISTASTREEIIAAYGPPLYESDVVNLHYSLDIDGLEYRLAFNFYSYEPNQIINETPQYITIDTTYFYDWENKPAA